MNKYEEVEKQILSIIDSVTEEELLAMDEIEFKVLMDIHDYLRYGTMPKPIV